MPVDQLTTPALSRWLAVLLCVALSAPELALAQQPEDATQTQEEARREAAPDLEKRAGSGRATIQRRFAPKARLLYGTATLMTHVRDDFYDSWGYGVDVGYFYKETMGVELRAMQLRTSLDDAALDLKERIGLTPDARPQKAWLMAGMRYAPGYGKMLMWRRVVVHFDPQLVGHLGAARAEQRWIPTLDLSLSFLTHWRWGIKAKLDLGMSMQLERRDRGWVFSTGFAPVLGVGWGYNVSK